MITKEYIHLTVLLIFLSFVSCDYSSNRRRVDNIPSTDEDELVDVEIEEEDCPNCYGRGYIQITCNECGGLGEKFHYYSGTRPKDCPACLGTGIARCETCDGYGYYRCEACNGRGSNQCLTCHGYGILSMGNQYIECFACKGSGYEKCVLCNGEGLFECSCDNGLGPCRTCWGRGKYGSESYSYSETEECFNCNGNGYIRERCTCCYGTGIIKVKKTIKKRKSEL